MMNPLSVSAIGPVTLSALSALRPVQAVAVPAPGKSTADATTLTAQDLVQTLFQRTLQAATAFPVAEPAAGSLGLIQETTASLLASLSAPQAAATTTPALDATTNPAAVQATPATAATTDTTTTTPTATVPGDVTATQDAFATSSSQDFALQTALRFGAGVSAQASPAPAATDLSAGLVRDAAAVPRLEGLQPHAGGPGPEAFAHPQAAQRVLRSYQAIPAAEGSVGLDLMA
jgi:hypothetical protein